MSRAPRKPRKNAWPAVEADRAMVNYIRETLGLDPLYGESVGGYDASAVPDIVRFNQSTPSLPFGLCQRKYSGIR